MYLYLYYILLYCLFVSCKFSYVQHSLLPLNVTRILSPPVPTNPPTLRTLVGREDAFDTMQKDFLEREGFRDKTSWAHGTGDHENGPNGGCFDFTYWTLTKILEPRIQAKPVICVRPVRAIFLSARVTTRSIRDFIQCDPYKLLLASNGRWITLRYNDFILT